MSDNTKIEFSKEGISLPYRRFLSDSASGFILILFLLFTFRDTSSVLDVNSLASEVRIFVLLLLFLLSTPIGAFINVLGWIFLESPQKIIEEILINKGFPKFKREFSYDDIVKQFCLDSKTWFRDIRILETKLTANYLLFTDAIESLRGITIFVTNLSLLCIVFAMLLLVRGSYRIETLAFLFILAFLFLLISINQCSHCFLSPYSHCLLGLSHGYR